MIASLLRKSIQMVPWEYRRLIKDLPLIGPAQRFLVDRLSGSRPFLYTIDAGPARGLRIWIQLPEDKQIWTGTYEAEFASMLAAAIQPGNVCLDVGGYRGFFAGVCALASASTVHIFEPLPSNISNIEALIVANPELPLVLHPVAMGVETGNIEFVVMLETSMGKLSNSSFQQQQGGTGTIAVRMETLDHLTECGALPEPDVIKIDVEGAEAMVLKGGEGVLRKRRPQLFMEVHSRELARECEATLTRFGYSVRTLETRRVPDFESEPEVCHFFAVAQG